MYRNAYQVLLSLDVPRAHTPPLPCAYLWPTPPAPLPTLGCTSLTRCQSCRVPALVALLNQHKAVANGLSISLITLDLNRPRPRLRFAQQASQPQNLMRRRHSKTDRKSSRNQHSLEQSCSSRFLFLRSLLVRPPVPTSWPTARHRLPTSRSVPSVQPVAGLCRWTCD